MSSTDNSKIAELISKEAEINLLMTNYANIRDQYMNEVENINDGKELIPEYYNELTKANGKLFSLATESRELLKQIYPYGIQNEKKYNNTENRINTLVKKLSDERKILDAEYQRYRDLSANESFTDSVHGVYNTRYTLLLILTIIIIITVVRSLVSSEETNIEKLFFAIIVIVIIYQLLAWIMSKL
jgi:phenylalanyl-tRNA synthetase alpha subunit